MAEDRQSAARSSAPKEVNTADERVMEKVDADGNVLGFSIMNVGSLEGKPFEVALA